MIIFNRKDGWLCTNTNPNIKSAIYHYIIGKIHLKSKTEKVSKEERNRITKTLWTLLHVIYSTVGLLCSRIQTEELTFACFYTLID